MEPLTKDNFLLYCARNYNAKYGASFDDLEQDIEKIKYIKKLITRYQSTGDLKERLILNHIIVLNNVFGPEVTCRILYFKLSDVFDIIKPFLVKINILPKFIIINEEQTIDTDLIPLDLTVVKALREI